MGDRGSLPGLAVLPLAPVVTFRVVHSPKALLWVQRASGGDQRVAPL